MTNKIKLEINKSSWEYFFQEITKEYKYDSSKVYFKLTDLYEMYLGKTMVKVGVVLKIKKIGFEYFIELIFGLQNDERLEIKEKIKIKSLIEKYMLDVKETEFFSKNKKNISFDHVKFIETGCGVINLKMDIWNKVPYGLFYGLLESIYQFLYTDIIQNKKDDFVFIQNPDLSEYEKDPEIPYWLEGAGLEKNEGQNSKNAEVQAIKKLSLQDMGGNKTLKMEIGKLISFYKNRDHFKKWNIEPPRGVLLYGPPGTGKTLTAKIIANEIGINFYTLSSSDILTKWIGESARNLKDFFKNLKTPCIVFMDEIDALAPNRDGNKSGKEPHEEEIQTINALLQEIDGFGEKKDILFVGATNRIEAIDGALLRSGRLDYKIFVDYPDFEARKEIWGIYLRKAKEKTNYDFLDDHVDFDILAKKSDKFTGADIAEVVRRLLSDYAIGSLVSSKVTNIIGGETTLKGLLYIISKFKDEKIFNHDIVPVKPETKLSDIGGSKILKEELKKIINQYKNKELFEELGVKPPRGILLYGPPGTGKTLAAKALAGEIGEIFYSIKASDFLSQWTNASVENLSKIFENFESPSVVFIDEIDAIAKNRDKPGLIPEEDIKVLNTFLQYIDGFDEKKDILFIGATNRIEALDKAIVRAGRFDTKVLVDYPDEEARIEIWKIYIEKSKTKSKKQNIFSSEIDYQKLAGLSEKMTGADIAEIVRRVKENFAINESKKSKKIISSTISQDEILEVLEKYKLENQMGKKEEKKIGFEVK